MRLTFAALLALLTAGLLAPPAGAACYPHDRNCWMAGPYAFHRYEHHRWYHEREHRHFERRERHLELR